MPIKVNEFVIQAKVNEGDEEQDSASMDDFVLPSSVKKEIIDECMEKMKEYLEKDKSRF